jgi:hypothetical protein
LIAHVRCLVRDISHACSECACALNSVCITRPPAPFRFIPSAGCSWCVDTTELLIQPSVVRGVWTRQSCSYNLPLFVVCGHDRAAHILPCVDTTELLTYYLPLFVVCGHDRAAHVLPSVVRGVWTRRSCSHTTFRCSWCVAHIQPSACSVLCPQMIGGDELDALMKEIEADREREAEQKKSKKSEE